MRVWITRVLPRPSANVTCLAGILLLAALVAVMCIVSIRAAGR